MCYHLYHLIYSIVKKQTLNTLFITRAILFILAAVPCLADPLFIFLLMAGCEE